MGNAASYSCLTVSIEILKSGCCRRSTKTAMLLDTSGKIREIKVPVRSAELMIEELGHVIIPVEELRRTRRISALPADQELLGGKVYLLAPVSRVHSKASESEMAIAEQWCSEKKSNKSGPRKKKSGNMAKVSPVSTLSGRDGEIEVSSFPGRGNLVGIPCHQLGSRGRWNPVLEPILESP
ncbi:uncharacterized protein LOC133285262 [Gastrolobium bilobum]|uniref:uncharacterized protein LOC133285262 n=1 Tax=Gastrolobium bilobum TaxID=150636 RepID=UPI002AB19818|nr:uncharacterized protein LOC133285262 [Gastrolobium bilobum]